MTISFKARVPQLTEDDILFNLPFDPLKDTWVWRTKAIKADDIVEIISISKNMCYITHYDYTIPEGGYKRTVIQETIADAILKWEMALATSVTFEDDEDPAPEGEQGNSGEDSPDEDEE